MATRQPKPAPMVPYVEQYNARCGWYLFPARVERGRKLGWLSRAKSKSRLNWGMSNDPVELRAIFSDQRYCDKCGIGLPTGEINGLFVVEVDTKQGHSHDGIKSLRALERKHGKLPDTLMVRSPSGSLHYYFNHPGRGVKVWSSASKLGDGVDVRGDGGMVVMPPSVREDGVYEWHGDTHDIVDAPEWLISLVTVQPAASEQSAPPIDDELADDPFYRFAQEIPIPLDVEELLDDLQFPGNVHDTEVRITASLLSQGMPVDEVVDLVMREVFERIPAARKWNRSSEITNIRKCCSDWLVKHDDVLDMQEGNIPDWLKPRLNGGRAQQQQEETEEEEQPAAPGMPWPVMGSDALYGLASEVVRLFEGRTEADSNAILIQFLTYFGNMVGSGHYYQVEGDKHHTNLFSVVVGDTSKARKGVSAGRTRQLMHAVDQINGGDWVEKCIKGGLSSGEGMIWDIRDDAIVLDANGDEVLGTMRDKRRLFDEREFSRVLAMMKREGNILSHIIRDAWDSRTLSVMTKNNPIRCSNPHVSMCVHITNDELRRDLDNTSMANGYANRFLYACAKRPIKLPFGSIIDPVQIKALAAKISAQFFKVFAVEKMVTMDKRASELWARAYDDLSEAKPGLVGAITARGEAQVIRLALIYALLDGGDEIKLPHLKAALAVWKYCEDSARFVFGKSLGDGVADQILEHLQHAGSTGMTRTDMHHMFGRNVSASRIAMALMLLRRYGYAKSTNKVGKGRPVETWYCS